MQEVKLHCAKVDNKPIPLGINFEDVTHVKELASFTREARNKTLIKYDPFAERFAQMLSAPKRSPYLTQFGFFPSPEIIAPGELKWYRRLAIILNQYIINFKFFLLTHYHPFEKVRNEAKAIQALFNEMHNGAFLLYRSRGPRSERESIYSKINITIDPNDSAFFWIYRMNVVAKSILSNRLPDDNEFKLSDGNDNMVMLLGVHGIHCQSENIYQDLQRPYLKGKPEEILEKFVIETHQPIIEHCVACQRLYDSIYNVAQNFHITGNNLTRIPLQDFIDKYEQCLNAYRRAVLVPKSL